MGNTLATLSDLTWLSPDNGTISLPTGVNRTVEVLRLAPANEVRGIIRPKCRWENTGREIGSNDMNWMDSSGSGQDVLALRNTDEVRGIT